MGAYFIGALIPALASALVIGLTTYADFQK